MMLSIYLVLSLFAIISAVQDLPGYMKRFSGNQYKNAQLAGYSRWPKEEQVFVQRRSLKGPVIDEIRHAVEQDVDRISDEVSYVSAQINSILNNPSISEVEKQRALSRIVSKHPKVAPIILHLMSKLRISSDSKSHFDY